jgi:hypothetical protein
MPGTIGCRRKPLVSKEHLGYQQLITTIQRTRYITQQCCYTQLSSGKPSRAGLNMQAEGTVRPQCRKSRGGLAPLEGENKGDG